MFKTHLLKQELDSSQKRQPSYWIIPGCTTGLYGLYFAWLSAKNPACSAVYIPLWLWDEKARLISAFAECSLSFDLSSMWSRSSRSLRSRRRHINSIPLFVGTPESHQDKVLVWPAYLGNTECLWSPQRNWLMQPCSLFEEVSRQECFWVSICWENEMVFQFLYSAGSTEGQSAEETAMASETPIR